MQILPINKYKNPSINDLYIGMSDTDMHQIIDELLHDGVPVFIVMNK